LALIVRIDVDRPYGRHPAVRHILSRISSDLYFPRIAGFGFLTELQTMLSWLNDVGAPAHVFFRRCTLPSQAILDLLDAGHHEIGLHLENSRSFGTFLQETQMLELHVGRKARAVSKHGSGGARFGLHHYAPYEPKRYIDWAQQTFMRLFLGNLQDPTLEPIKAGNGLAVFPSAFWLEPPWRDTRRFTVAWLLDHARTEDIVLLVHPENVLAHPDLVTDFKKLIETLETKVFQ
jgi:hypothetical protein